MNPYPPQHVRGASGADVPEIVRRWQELMAAHRDLHSQLYRLRPGAPRLFEGFIRRQIESHRGIVLVAPQVGRPQALVGYLMAQVGTRAPVYEVREVGMIFDLAVRPDARRRGVGRALVEASHRCFRARGVAFVQVNFALGNPSASRFWPELGYDPFLIDGYRAL